MLDLAFRLRRRPRRRPRRIASVRTVGTAAALGTATVLAATVLAVGPSAGASADPPGIPTESEVATSRADAAVRAADVGRAQAKLTAADARVQELNNETEAVVEAYNAARVRLERATATAAAAAAELAAAEDRVAAAQADVRAFVAASYRSGGQVTQVAALLGSTGPATYLQQAGALQAVSRRQQQAVGLLSNARIVRQLAQRRAERMLASERDTAGAAETAQVRAESALADQRRVLADLTADRQALQQQLIEAQARADTVARTREEGLARARATAEATVQAEAQARATAEAEAKARAAAATPAVGGASTSVASAASPSAVGAVRVASSGGTASAQQGAVAVQFATAQLGKAYVWGAEGPDTFDCSGLTMRAWQRAGVWIDHWTGSQWLEGTPVARSAIQPGDLLFFATNTANPDTIHHVGLYIGNGMMIHAPQTGDVVKISPAGRSDFIGAVRP